MDKNNLGIILAGGTGTRLYPFSSYINKHLLPLYDKPILDYAISNMIMLDIDNVLILSDIETIKILKKRYSNLEKFGIKIKYTIQNEAKGIPEIFKLEAEYIYKFKKICLHLGDNFFYGSNLFSLLKENFKNFKSSKIFTYSVENTWDYGILELNENKLPKKITEKPINTNSKRAITGLYFFENDVIEKSKKLKISKRGELEITDILNSYLKEKKLTFIDLPRGSTWYDAGSPKRLIEVSEFVSMIEKRQGLKIGCIEEICFRKKLISKKDLKKIINQYPNSEYKYYLENVLNEN